MSVSISKTLTGKSPFCPMNRKAIEVKSLLFASMKKAECNVRPKIKRPIFSENFTNHGQTDKM